MAKLHRKGRKTQSDLTIQRELDKIKDLEKFKKRFTRQLQTTEILQRKIDALQRQNRALTEELKKSEEKRFQERVLRSKNPTLRSAWERYLVIRKLVS